MTFVFGVHCNLGSTSDIQLSAVPADIEVSPAWKYNVTHSPRRVINFSVQNGAFQVKKENRWLIVSV